MNIVQNPNQEEFLMTIRDFGMQIVFKKANAKDVLEYFAVFSDYIEDIQKRMSYIDSLEKITKLLTVDSCSPDDLLLELGQYTPYIIYHDETYESKLYEDDEGWLYQ